MKLRYVIAYLRPRENGWSGFWLETDSDNLFSDEGEYHLPISWFWSLNYFRIIVS